MTQKYNSINIRVLQVRLTVSIFQIVHFSTPTWREFFSLFYFSKILPFYILVLDVIVQNVKY